MKKFIFSFCILLSINAMSQQEIDRTISCGGIVRQYHLYIPDIYRGNKAVPLLFNLHGLGSNNLQQQTYGYFNSIADTANFIMCLPNGTFLDTNKRFWNAGFASYAVNDIGFLQALIDTLYKTYNIDPTRIYFTGMSNGGFMSHTMACACADRVAAVASVAGGMAVTQYNSCSPSRPISVMEIHGDADLIVPYSGHLVNEMGVTINIVPIDTMVKGWINHNSCSGTPAITNIPNINTGDASTATRYDYTCQSGSSFVLYKVTGGGHTWPGGFAIPSSGPTNHDFNASIEIWKFLRQYRNMQSVVGIGEVKEKETSVYPNPCHDEIYINHNGEGNYSRFIISDIDGKSILSGTLSNDGTINTSSLKAGVYIVNLQGKKSSAHIKLLKF